MRKQGKVWCPVPASEEVGYGGLVAVSLSKAKLGELIGATALQGSDDDARIVFSGVEFDSREVRGGELFFALPGAATHGHQFVEQVLNRGASLAVVEDATLFESSMHKERILAVRDSLQAFSALAKWWRRELNIPIFAVTGSVGKTTVKEMAAHILLGSGPGAYSQRSFNNHVGVPYTICRFGREHRWAVLEMGMSHSGEIEQLSFLAEPNHVAITTIAAAHAENFPNLAAIAAAKFEIVKGLTPGGSVALRAEDPELRSAIKTHDPQGKLNVHYFGSSPECAARVSNVTSHGFDGIGFELTLTIDGKSITAPVMMNILGTQNAYNAACAVLAARWLAPKITIEEIVSRLESFTAPLMRMNCRSFEGGWRLIDDSYNANPASMGAFLDFASELKSVGYRVSLILGDMLELGPRSEHYHREVGRRIAQIQPDLVVAVGPLASYYLDSTQGEPSKPGAPEGTNSSGAVSSAGITAPAQRQDNYRTVNSPSEAAALVLDLPPSVVMVKGSRGIHLDQAVKMIDTRLIESAPS